MFKKNVVVFAISIIFAGCASFYKAGAGAEVVDLVSTSNHDMVFVQAFSDTDCGTHPNGTRISYFSMFTEFESSTPIEVGKELYVTYALEAGVYNVDQCRIMVSFTPEFGKRYYGDFRVDEKKCYLDMYEVDIQGEISSKRPIKGLKEAPKACFNMLNG